MQAMLRACHQSEVIADRAELERAVREALAAAIWALPDHWGGFRLQPRRSSSGKAARTGCKIACATRAAAHGWRIERLVP